MSKVVQDSTTRFVRAPTATYKVSFQKRRKEATANGKPEPVGRIPRVTRLLALAHRIERMIRAGVLKDWAEAARLIGVTRARMSQIGNLLLLAPEIQEVILIMRPIVDGPDPVTERTLRSTVTKADWDCQRSKWAILRPFSTEFPLNQPPRVARRDS